MSKQFWNEKELLISSLNTSFSVVRKIVSRESENADSYKVSRIMFAAIKRPDFTEEQVLELMELMFPGGETYERRPKKPRPNFQLKFAEASGLPVPAVNYLLFREFNASAWRKDWLSLNGMTLAHLLKRADTPLESLVEVASRLLGEVSYKTERDTPEVAALTILLSRPDCPEHVLSAACLSPNIVIREQAFSHPNCPEESRVAVALLTPVKKSLSEEKKSLPRR